MIHALITLLMQGAMRIQDAVGLTFRDITSLKADKDGRKKLTLCAKKTTARDVFLNDEAIKAVKTYQADIGAKADDIIFEQGATPGAETSRWSKQVSSFFKKYGLKVTTHDFRTTMITSFYNETKDLVKT